MSERAANQVGTEIATTRRRVIPFVLIAVAALMVGMWAGLARIGWALPGGSGDVMLRHGGLMVVGFVSTVIGVERAVAVRTTVSIVGPAFSAGAGLALIVGASPVVAPALAVAAGIAYLLNMTALVRTHGGWPLRLMMLGAVGLVIAAAEWLAGRGFAQVVPWWMAFLALTIGAERLELLRFQRTGRITGAAGVAAVALIMLGPVIAVMALDIGVRVLGAGLLLGSGWLIVRDHPRRGIRTGGLSRFIAVGLLCAYGWLAFTGIALIAEGLSPGGWHYDAVVHAFFIGVVMSSIFAHEPFIAPSVSGLDLPYTPVLYLPLVLLEGSLVARIAADAAEAFVIRRWAGLVQVMAIVLLLGITGMLVGRSVFARRRHPSSRMVES